ncbi:hypothetical protein KP509_31G055800 [Ceratopteris richardii]|uniref:Uncharacterized protein n=1 Tax=Ceratopteris richardii TaxID=49495 RepID=A0A8T2QY92_CERRI|nr:hypothetical protein KP509_31G055800 [Ceratopteris richardii]
MGNEIPQSPTISCTSTICPSTSSESSLSNPLSFPMQTPACKHTPVDLINDSKFIFAMNEALQSTLTQAISAYTSREGYRYSLNKLSSIEYDCSSTDFIKSLVSAEVNRQLINKFSQHIIQRNL